MSGAQIQQATASAWPGLGFEPGQVFRICGMRRSGNHAISNWLQRNSPSGEALFLNNCKPGTDPLGSFRGLEVNGKRISQERKADSLANVPDGALFLFSYEDTSIAEGEPSRVLSKGVDQGSIDREVVVYRSFLNWSASLLKKMQRNSSLTTSRCAGILLRAIDPYVRCLELVLAGGNPKLIGICYDDWAAKPGYRTDLLAELGLPELDNDLGPVQKYGGGSSFQPDAKVPDMLETQSRSEQMAHDADYQAILHLAARDPNLTSKLGKVFPNDAALLQQIAGNSPISAQVLK